MCKAKKNQSWQLRLNKYSAHRQSWPICLSNRTKHFAFNLSFIEKHIIYALQSSERVKKNEFVTIRPLSFLKRFETGKICMFWHLPIYPDSSNQRVKFLRNRLRKQLLPSIKIFFNPQIENVLLQFAEIVDAENCYINQTITPLVKTFVNPKIQLLSFIHLFSFPKSWNIETKVSLGTENRNLDAFTKSNKLMKLNSVLFSITSTEAVQRCELPQKEYKDKVIFNCSRKNATFKAKNENCRQTLAPDSEEFTTPNLFFRFSTPKRTAYWAWSRRAAFTENEEEKRLFVLAYLSPCSAQVIWKHSRQSKANNLISRNQLKKSQKKRSPRVNLNVAFIEGGRRSFHPVEIKDDRLLAILDCKIQAFFPLGLSKNLPLSTTIFGTKKLKTRRNFFFSDFYIQEMKNKFVTKFLLYFETLEPEKREIYWPIVMSFLPKALQRRVIKLFLATHNWKNIRYSHIERFLSEKKIYTV